MAVLAFIITGTASTHDFFREISSASDQDFVVIYNALRMNDGLPQTMFGHTGYTYFLILSQWLQALDLINLIPISKISELPEPDQFESTWEVLVYAGRALSIFLSFTASFVFYFILKLVIENRNLAAAFAILFAISPGLVRHSLVMRTELPSFVFFIIALLFTLRAGRSKPWNEFYYVFLAAFFATMAVMAKMQSIPLVLALPIIGLVINSRIRETCGPTHIIYPLPIVAAASLILLAISIPAQVMVWTQTFPAMPQMKMVFNSGYQILIMIYFITIISLYNLLDRRSLKEFILSISFISCGMAVAFYSNFFNHTVTNTAQLVNFIDNMSLFARKSLFIEQAPVSGFNLFVRLLIEFGDALTHTFQRNFFAFEIFKLPYTLAYGISALSAFYFLIYKKWRQFLIIGTLLTIAIGMEAFSGFRNFFEHYRIYYEVWILLSSAFLAQYAIQICSLTVIKTYGIVKITIFLLITVILSYTTVGSLGRAGTSVEWQARDNACFQARGYMKDLVTHFCSNKFLRK